MLIDKVCQTIVKYDMIKKHDKVIVGVSGGPDSVVLLHVLVALRERMKLFLHVAHLNHRLRGSQADKDAEFVKFLAGRFNLPFTVKAVDVAAFSKRKKLTLEEAARHKRYDFLWNLSRRIKARKIALGHNADDEVETIMMWLLRGAGRGGLTGIPPTRKIKQTDDIDIIRPLIEIPRKEIENYLKKLKIPYRVDKSNLNPLFMRNKIRLKLLPLIRNQYSPNFDSLLLQTARILRDEKKILDKEIDKTLKRLMVKISHGKISIDLNKFLRYNVALERQVIRRIVWLVSCGKISFDYRKIADIIKFARKSEVGKKLLLTASLVVKKSYGLLEFVLGKELKKSEKSFYSTLKVPGTTNIPHLNLIVDTSVFKKPRKFRYSKSKYIAHLDLEQIKLPITIRNRRKGDRINPLGIKGNKKIKDFFIDCKIPREQRDSIPLVTSGKKILWVTGYPHWSEQISNKVKVTPKTDRILEIKLIP